MDPTPAAATALAAVPAAHPVQTISNETFGLWFVILLIVGVLLFLFWGG